MADLGERRSTPGRRRWRRRALSRSRPALALGALVVGIMAVLLLLGMTRARPGNDIPAYEPEVTTTSSASGPVPAPVITAVRGPVRAPVITGKAPVRPVKATTTTGHR